MSGTAFPKSYQSLRNQSQVCKQCNLGGKAESTQTIHVFSLQPPAFETIQVGSSNAIGWTGEGNWK